VFHPSSTAVRDSYVANHYLIYRRYISNTLSLSLTTEVSANLFTPTTLPSSTWASTPTLGNFSFLESLNHASLLLSRVRTHTSDPTPGHGFMSQEAILLVKTLDSFSTLLYDLASTTPSFTNMSRDLLASEIQSFDNDRIRSLSGAQGLCNRYCPFTSYPSSLSTGPSNFIALLLFLQLDTAQPTRQRPSKGQKVITDAP
jgi:hypothetical protein